MIEEKFLTTEQVANILQVHPFTILKYIKQGKLKGIKLGRVYRLIESDVKKFLEERLIGQGRTPDLTLKGEGNAKSPQEEAKKNTAQQKKINKGSEEGEHYYII